MDVRCTIKMLGGLQVEHSGRVINRFRTYKTAVLLAYLAYNKRRAHPREELIDLLWPECDSAQGRNSLSQSLSSLRNQLEPPGVPHGAILRADRTVIQLDPAAVHTDVAAFEDAIRSALRPDQSGAAPEFRRLADAVALYGGELLPGHYEDWNLTERERLRELYLDALGRIVAHLETKGEIASALDYARRALSADPQREKSHADLIRLYAAAGDAGAAVRQYVQLERMLEEEFGSTPDPAIRDLLAEVRSRPASAKLATKSKTAPPEPAGVSSPDHLPAGTVTLLVADGIPDVDAAARLRGIFLRYGGKLLREGDESAAVVFSRASDAVAAATASQRSLSNGEPALRVALHTGEIEKGDQLAAGAIGGLTLEHAERILLAAHPGQVFCSEATAALLQRDLEPGFAFAALGVFRLSGETARVRLFAVDYPGMPKPPFPPPCAEAGYEDNLPLPLSRFVGRENEVARLVALLIPTTDDGQSEGEKGRNGEGEQESHGRSGLGPDAALSPLHPLSASHASRLVTLTGPGGTGKTRLALEVARRLLPEYQGACWFVPLADVTDPGLVVDAILTALRLVRSPSVDPLSQIVQRLRERPSLLVLDNFEQLVGDSEGAGRQEAESSPAVRTVRALLEQSATLKCLVASRRLLALAGEKEFPLAPLPTPDRTDSPERLSRIESVQLFVDRAQAFRPDFQVTQGNAAAVAALCERLEGIPLAIELAAGRAQVLAPHQILAHLTHRLDFLVSRRQDSEPRHRTVRAAIDWSYWLLSSPVQRFFARLSVFRGGWTLEAAEAVCDPGISEEAGLALDHIAILRECSLIVLEEAGREGAGETRFRMLETLREYAEEKLKLEEADDLRRRHAEHFVALAEQATPMLHGPDQAAWLSRLDAEHENMRAALRWCIERGETEMAARFGAALWWFWYVRGHIGEGREMFTRILAMPESAARTVALAKALNGAGSLAWYQGDYAAAGALYEQSLTIRRELGDRKGEAAQLDNLGYVARERGYLVGARALHEESLEIFRELGHDKGIARSLASLGYVASQQGDYAAARARHAESLAVFRTMDDRWGIARALNDLGEMDRRLGNRASARALLEEGLAMRRDLGDRWGIADSLGSLANVAREEGDFVSAREQYAEALTILRELVERAAIANTLEQIGMMAAAQGMPGRASRLYGAAETIRSAIGVDLKSSDRADYERSLATLRASLGERDFAESWSQGSRLTLEQAIDAALADY